MAEAPPEFTGLVGMIVRRFCAQNGQPVPAEGALAFFSARLWAVIELRGLPPPLRPGERGEPGSMAESECAQLVAHVVEPGGAPLLREAARQLVKACFHPEFTVCRDSFRAVSPDGACRRQELARARGRVSGSHCVDCPHWVALPSAPHAAMLAREWQADRSEFESAREIFLPEDFRALRQWLHARARIRTEGAQ